MKFLIIILNLILFSYLTVSAHEGHMDHAAEEAKPVSGNSIYNLKSTWTSQDGKNIKLSQLRGKTLIVAMAYTSCEHACPLLVEDMRKIEKGIADKDAVFALFSFDSEKDTPAKLKDYAVKKRLSERWLLLNGNKKVVRELAAVLGIKYSHQANGDFDHSNIVSLVDKDGIIRFQQMGLNNDPAEFLKNYSELKK
jgi:protein SCO1/2